MLAAVIAFALGITVGALIVITWALGQYERGFEDARVMQARKDLKRLTESSDWRHA